MTELRRLMEEKPISCKQIEKTMSLSHSTACALIRAMEQRAHVESIGLRSPDVSCLTAHYYIFTGKDFGEGDGPLPQTRAARLERSLNMARRVRIERQLAIEAEAEMVRRDEHMDWSGE